MLLRKNKPLVRFLAKGFEGCCILSLTALIQVDR